MSGDLARERVQNKNLIEHIISHRTYVFSPEERRFLRRLAFLHPIRYRRLVAEMRLIAVSPLFDCSYYRQTNEDADKTPLLHFCQEGWRNGRNPSEYFDISRYLNDNQTCDPHENPLVHFLRNNGGGECFP